MDKSTMKAINWQQFTNEYVSVEPGVMKKLVLTNWREDHSFERPGIAFTVVEEDGIPVEKTFVTRSTRLLRKLIPILQKAEDAGKQEVKVSILRIGEGFETSYVVKE